MKKEYSDNIKPKLGLFDTIMVAVSLVVGIGIFRTPQIVASETGNIILFFTAWITGGLISLCGGMTFAELGSRKPYAGGFYKLISDAYHPSLAFMLNWLGLIISSGATFAAVAILSAEYLFPLLPLGFIEQSLAIKLLALVITLFLFIVNYIGIKSGAVVLNLITILKTSLVFLFVIFAFVTPETPVNKIGINSLPESSWFFPFSLGLISVFFTYGGYQLTMNLAGDIKNPKFNLKWGILVANIIVIFIYISINYGYYRLLGFEEIKNSPLIAADMADVIFGSAGKKIISIAISLSAIGFLNVMLMHTPRTFYAMTEDKILPEFFKKVNPKTQAQEFTLIFLSILGIIFIFLEGRFDKAINLIMFNDALTIAVVASTIFVFRKRKDSVEYDGFIVPVKNILPAIFILFLLLVSFNAFMKDYFAGIMSTLVLLAGFPLYVFLKKMKKK
jgi:APA family basic amino acid/polyamine antiporter